ncbi:MAG: DUF3168 domain-containing protein, partial [Planctomycetota bacterium]
HIVRFTIASRWGGRKECKEIATSMRALLQDARFALEGHELLQARLVFEDHLRHREPDVYQATLRYRFITVPHAEAAA